MNNYQIGLTILSCVSVITVTGVYALTGLCGMFSLGQAAFMCIGAYGTFMLTRYAGIPLIPAALLGVLAGVIVAWVVGRLTLKLRRDYFALMTVALGQAIPSLVVVFSEYTNGALGFTKIPKVNGLIWITLGITVLVVFCIRNLKYSRYGRMCLALKTDELAAKSFGINVYKLKVKIYILASAIACIAGILFALRNRYIDNTQFNWALSAEMQIFLFFGGSNSLTGAVVSAFVLKMLPNILRNVQLFGVSMQEYRIILYCILVLIILNFRPAGIMGEHELNFRWVSRLTAKIKNASGRNGGKA
ncbi:MAG: branched-chain amino acid ABC transporter permease [Clostridiaceae bacterium]|nr:branched-chain amino acid ABC transporter permease [Clostridiaceae bacterium]